MYAIAFDLQQDLLSQTYGSPTCTNAYTDIKKTLTDFGFNRQQGSVYFGDSDKNVDAVTCVMAVQELTQKYDWFAPSVKDIRMLRIEEDNNLMPAIEKITAICK